MLLLVSLLARPDLYDLRQISSGGTGPPVSHSTRRCRFFLVNLTMRRAEFLIQSPALLETFLAEVDCLHLGTLDEQGGPYVTAVNFVFAQGKFYFHSSLRGRKMENLRRFAPVYLSVAQEFSFIPSYATHPQEACGATQFFRSVHVAGTAVELENLETKTRALNALMAKMQPEGGYQPLSPLDPNHQKALKATAVVEITPVSITGKFKFGQNLKGERRLAVLDSLRHSPDPRAASTLAWMESLGEV